MRCLIEYNQRTRSVRIHFNVRVHTTEDWWDNKDQMNKSVDPDVITSLFNIEGVTSVSLNHYEARFTIAKLFDVKKVIFNALLELQFHLSESYSSLEIERTIRITGNTRKIVQASTWLPNWQARQNTRQKPRKTKRVKPKTRDKKQR